jgi:hypothetical protein
VWPVFIVIAALSLCATAQAQARARDGHPDLSARAAKGEDRPEKKTGSEKKEPAAPMVFFIAKGEPDSCGKGCSEWIAADGKIDGSTPRQLRALLGGLGKRKLPIFFQSPGGDVQAALAIGRMMRLRGMTAGVGRTIPQGCDPAQSREPACDALKRSGRELPAELRTANASCNSACVYALIGAKVREVAPGASLGIHNISVTRMTVRRNREGKIVATSSAKLSGDANGVREGNGKIARYAGEMDVSRALVDAAAAVPNGNMRYISRDEIARFGIDQRAFAESRWTVQEQKPGSFFIGKILAEAKLDEVKAGVSTHYRALQVLLLCGRSGFINVAFARELDASDRLAFAAVAAGGSEVRLTLGRTQTSAKLNGIDMEIWLAPVPRAFFDNAALGDSIELVETPAITALNAPPRRMTLSTAGLASSVSSFGRICRWRDEP